MRLCSGMCFILTNLLRNVTFEKNYKYIDILFYLKLNIYNSAFNKL